MCIDRPSCGGLDRSADAMSITVRRRGGLQRRKQGALGVSLELGLLTCSRKGAEVGNFLNVFLLWNADFSWPDQLYKFGLSSLKHKVAAEDKTLGVHWPLGSTKTPQLTEYNKNASEKNADYLR